MLCDMNHCFSEFLELCKTHWLEPATKLVMHQPWKHYPSSGAAVCHLLCKQYNPTQMAKPNGSLQQGIGWKF